MKGMVRLAWVITMASLGCGRIGFDDLTTITPDQARRTLSVGEGLACVIRSGQVWCWGEGSAGQLGQPAQFAATPIQVPGLPAVNQVSVGDVNACAVTIDGEVYCWGPNDFLQLGVPRAKPGLPDSGIQGPTRVPGLPARAVEVGVGAQHVCTRLDDTTVWCWGASDRGQLGLGPTIVTPQLPTVVPTITNAAELAIAAQMSCIRRGDGTVACWGDNQAGQLGDATAPSFRPTPGDVPGVIASAIAAGGQHVCALVAGRYVCWGSNEQAQLGDGTFTSRGTPAPPSAASGLIALAASRYHTCAIRDGGDVGCWGGNFDGTLGDGTTEFRTLPVGIEAGRPVVALAAGLRSTCGLRDDDVVMCWGVGARGAIGDGRSAVARALATGVAATQIAVSERHSCAITPTGDVTCWGDNRRGQLGDGTTSSRVTPSKVMRTWGTAGALELAVGADHSCLRTDAREVYCWGSNEEGQLGDGTFDQRSIPTRALTGASKLDAGAQHTCAILEPNQNDLVQCWGANTFGQLGDNTTTKSSVPVTVLDTNLNTVTATAIAVGDAHGCVMRATTEVLCWGNDQDGQAGGNGTRSVANLVDLGAITASSSLVAGSVATCVGAGGDPDLTCWGRNEAEVLVPGGLDSIPPTQIPHALLSLGRGTACNDRVCRGVNFFGQLGNGTYTSSAEPAGEIVDLPASASRISVGLVHACAIASGEVYCWGDNTDGQLGAGVVTRALSPVMVVGLP